MENQNQNPNGYPPILFVTAEHLMKLLDKSESTAYKELSDIRTKYHIVKPKKVTLAIACDYYEITEKQFYQKYYGY